MRTSGTAHSFRVWYILIVETNEVSDLKTNRYGWLVLSVTSLGVLLTMLNIGTLNVALPVVAKHFHADATTGNWILLSYMLFSTVFILMFGRLADLFGRRRLYLVGLSVFTGVSLLLGIAPNIWVFLFLRVIQAAGGAIIITNTTPLLTDAFPEQTLSKGLGINVLVASAAQLAGPVVGGFFAANLSWSWVFWFNVPFGIIGIVWAAITLRGIPSKGTREKFDVSGNILVLFALAGCIYSLSEGGTMGWLSPSVLIGWGIFLVATPIFLWVEWKSTSPLMNLRLFGQRRYAAAYVATFFNSFARTGVVLLIALYEQTINHNTPFAAGVAVLPVTVGMIVLSPVAGSLSSRFDARVLSSTGLVLSGIGILSLFVALDTPSGRIVDAIGMFLVGAGSALFMTPNTSSIMMSVHTNQRGSANGLRSMLQNMGQVMSTALSLMLVTAALPRQLQASVYAGQDAGLSAMNIMSVVNGFKVALLAMFIATIFAIVTSLVRGPKLEAARMSNV